MIVFRLDPPCFTSGFLKLWLAVLVFKTMRPLHCFIIVFKLIKCFYDDALRELVNYYANRALIVSCTKDYT